LSTRSDRLSSKEDWSERWAGQPVEDITFNPNQPGFRDQHKTMMRTLPRRSDVRFLEVGCYPGYMMWYFHQYFGYQVTGLEYIDWCCDRTRELLAKHNVRGDVVHGDLFSWRPESPEARWDVVSSFGLIEHFEGTTDVIQKHLDLLKPGGYLVIGIPIHSGIYGRILKAVNAEEHAIHNLMNYNDMVRALDNTGEAEIVAGGYCGRIGFWNTGLYGKMRQKGRLAYTLVRAPLWTLERVGRILPNTATFSPNALLVARKSI